MTKQRKKMKRLTGYVPPRRNHSEMLQTTPNDSTWSLDLTVNTEELNSNLQTLVERWRSRMPTLDALPRYCRIGDLQSMSEQLISLPWSTGCRGSLGAMTVTTDEWMRELQSAQRHMGMTWLPNPVTMCKSCKCHKPSHSTSLIFYLNRTHSFATHIIAFS